jgi:hypothetical protein
MVTRMGPACGSRAACSLAESPAPRSRRLGAAAATQPGVITLVIAAELGIGAIVTQSGV